MSIATVSAALNDASGQRRDPAARLGGGRSAVGYSPNAVARSLRSGKSRLIGLVIGDIANPFWRPLVRVVEKVALAAGYSIIVCNTDEDAERELAMLDQLRAQHVAGILLTPIGRGEDYVRRLEARNLRRWSPWTNACRDSPATMSGSTTAPPPACSPNISSGSVTGGSP